MKIRIVAIGVALIAMQSCQKQTSVDKDVEEAKVATLERERNATPEDGATRLKRLIDEFPSTFKGRSAQWRVVSYDIRKTDSVVSPLVAVMSIDCQEPTENLRYQVYLALQNGVWRIMRMGHLQYRPGSKPDEEMSPLPDDASDVDWQHLESYLK